MVVEGETLSEPGELEVSDSQSRSRSVPEGEAEPV